MTRLYPNRDGVKSFPSRSSCFVLQNACEVEPTQDPKIFHNLPTSGTKAQLTRKGSLAFPLYRAKHRNNQHVRFLDMLPWYSAILDLQARRLFKVVARTGQWVAFLLK